jgi:uncharacterized protein (TIGR00369 family)
MVTDAVSELRYGFADHHCFACGTTNPIGMGLRIELGDQRATTTWIPGADDVGWSDRVHGGLIATVLDEVMAWASGSEDAWAVTSSFSVRFHSPASPGETLRAEGWVASRRRRIYEIKGEVRAADRLVAEATGTYLAASPTQKTELKQRYGVRSSGAAATEGVS